MNLIELNFHGDPNIGLYGKACDKFCLVGNFITDDNQKRLEKYLDVPVKKCFVAGTDLVGLFAAVNSNGILLSGLANDNEIKHFQKIADEFGINLGIVHSKFSAVGNLILCNDKGGIASKLFTKAEVKKMGECLDVEIVRAKVAKTDIVGSSGIATGKGCLLHRDASEREIELVERTLKVEADIGTANFGSPFVGAGIITNSHGTLIGTGTTSPEMQRIVDTLKLE